MRIFLVRHGESEGNVDHSVHERMADHAISLSDHGMHQAFRAGQFLYSELNKININVKKLNSEMEEILKYQTIPGEK
jgi:broad specificity phosphatase PhoE